MNVYYTAASIENYTKKTYPKKSKTKQIKSLKPTETNVSRSHHSTDGFYNFVSLQFLIKLDYFFSSTNTALISP